MKAANIIAIEHLPFTIQHYRKGDGLRAFRVAWQALVSLYSELFFLIGISLLWWVTGGVFVALVVVLAWLSFANGGVPAWYVPLLAIPAGPASAGLATVARQVARDLHADFSIYWQGIRDHWRQALLVNAAGMLVLSLLILNVQFYAPQSPPLLRIFAVFWFYLLILATAAQLYLFPVLIGLVQPSAVKALKTAAVMAVINPIYSVLMILITLVLTGVTIALAAIVILIWPALTALLGEHSLMLFVARGKEQQERDRS